MTIEMRLRELQKSKEELHQEERDALREQCRTCKLGNKDIGPRSGCDIRKKLVIDDNKVAWKNKHLFFEKGKCKMYKEKK